MGHEQGKLAQVLINATCGSKVGRRCVPAGRKDFAVAPAAQLRRLCEVANDLTRRPAGQLPRSR